jgi:hypothetical protein
MEGGRKAMDFPDQTSIRNSSMHPAARGVLTSLIVVAIYFLVVVATTPSLPPLYALAVTVTLNWWVITGLALGTGIQTFLVSYSKSRGCDFRRRRQVAGSSGVLSVFSSFPSFLALIGVGCCGSWLYVLSLLPGLFGTGASAFLIDNSRSLALVGLLLMAASVLYTYFSVRSRLRAMHDGSIHIMKIQIFS